MTPSSLVNPFSPSFSASLRRPSLLIERFAEVARPILLERFTSNCCIGATAVAIKVFRTLGIKAQPFACRLLAFNTAFMAQAEAAGHLPHSPEEIKSFVSDGVSWSVGIGWPHPDLNEYTGHLVAILPDHHLLIDAAIEQINRPAKNINYPPVLVLETPPTFWHDRTKTFYESESGLLIYEPSTDRSWRNAPDWTDDARHAEPVRKILEKISPSEELNERD